MYLWKMQMFFTFYFSFQAVCLIINLERIERSTKIKINTLELRCFCILYFIFYLNLLII
jgi:hypothetical protein